MILPLGATSPDTGYQFQNLYGIGYGLGGRAFLRQLPASTVLPERKEVWDIMTLSPAAQRIMDQAERMVQIRLSAGGNV